MKRLGKVFWGVCCMILLFAFSHASDGDICAPNTEVVNTKEKVQFEWDAVTTNKYGKPIDKEKFEVKYEVYRLKAENEDENPPTTEAQIEAYKKNKTLKLKEYKQTKETSMPITFEVENKDLKNKDLYYLLGVRAIAINKKNGKIEGRSDVSWSCYKKCTIKPQKVKVVGRVTN